MTGANVNAIKMHQTALHVAAKNTLATIDFLSLLLDFGANIYARNNWGKLASDLALPNSASKAFLKHYESKCMFGHSCFNSSKFKNCHYAELITSNAYDIRME